MTITITGASGHLGRLAVADLLSRQVPGGDIVAAVRSPEQATDIADRGVQVRHADYDEPDTLEAAFDGTDRLLLISSNAVGFRSGQHRNVIDAAVSVGVRSIAYTSIVNAATTRVALAADHKATEERLVASGLPYTLLRNSWYLEVYTASLPTYLENGAVLGAADDGRVAAAARADYAAAAATVLTTDGHDGAVYELGGEPFTLGDLADAITLVTGTPVSYINMPPGQLAGALAGAGVPEQFAQMLADGDQGIARGDLATDSGDLARLLGRPPISLMQAVSLAAP